MMKGCLGAKKVNLSQALHVPGLVLQLFETPQIKYLCIFITSIRLIVILSSFHVCAFKESSGSAI